MPALPFPLPALIKDEQLSIAPLLHIASFLFFSDIWARHFHTVPLLEWDFSTRNIPNLFCHFIFLAMLYGVLFRLAMPTFLLGFGMITSPLFRSRANSRDSVSDDWYGRYAAEINNATAYKVMEEHRLSRDRAFWTMVLISLSLLLFSLDAALCRAREGTIAHLVLPPGISPWIPALGFLAYLGTVLGWCVNGWGIESYKIPVTKAFREEIEQREEWIGIRGQGKANRVSQAFTSGGGPERGQG